MLCRICGVGEREHNATHTFVYPNLGSTGLPSVSLPSVWPAKTEEINPKFHAALNKIKEIHDKKSQDYAHDSNRYSNFEEAAETAGCSVDTVFAVLIGIKMARLRELLSTGKIPNNESIQDTRLDLAVYSVLWMSYHE